LLPLSAIENHKHARNSAFSVDLRKLNTYGGLDTIYKHRQLCYTMRAKGLVS
jgi:hypothetical protein